MRSAQFACLPLEGKLHTTFFHLSLQAGDSGPSQSVGSAQLFPLPYAVVDPQHMLIKETLEYNPKIVLSGWRPGGLPSSAFGSSFSCQLTNSAVFLCLSTWHMSGTKFKNPSLTRHQLNPRSQP